jgi:leader peptidase (prepilin peptidase)/N-methyltransferase
MTDVSGVDPGWFEAIAFLLGLLVGSFLNVVIHRLPRGESVVRPRSRCPHCGHAITAFENVPVLSYLALRGSCRGCGARIALRYPALELLTGLVFFAVVARHGVAPGSLALFVFASLLIAASAIDFEHRIIPDAISVGGLVAGLVLAPAAAWLEGASPEEALLRSAAGAALGFGMLWSVGFVHARVCAASGRRFAHWPGDEEAFPRAASLDYWTWFPGMGFGDVKLMAMIGAFVGPAGVIEALVLGSAAGLVLGLSWMLLRRDWNAPFGFGPALAAGALLVALSPWRLPLPF